MSLAGILLDICEVSPAKSSPRHFWAPPPICEPPTLPEPATHTSTMPAPLHPRPRGRGPRDCRWDPQHGVWRRNADGEIYDPAAREAARGSRRNRGAAAAAARTQAAAHMRNAYARATRARRNTRVNAARCNETVLAPAFDLEAVKPEDVGLLGAATCGHCHARPRSTRSPTSGATATPPRRTPPSGRSRRRLAPAPLDRGGCTSVVSRCVCLPRTCVSFLGST